MHHRNQLQLLLHDYSTNHPENAGDINNPKIMKTVLEGDKLMKAQSKTYFIRSKNEDLFVIELEEQDALFIRSSK